MKTNNLKALLLIAGVLFLSCNSDRTTQKSCVDLKGDFGINNEILIGKMVEENTTADQIKKQFPDYILLKDPQYDNPNDTGNLRLLVKENSIYQNEEVSSNRSFYFVDNKLARIEYEFSFEKSDTVKVSSFLIDNGLSFLRECVDYDQCYILNANGIHYECLKSIAKLTNGGNTIRYNITSSWN